MNKSSQSLSLAQKLHQQMIQLRRDFHMNPEVGFDVQRTAGIVAKELQKLNLTVKTNVGKTGVVADLTIPGATKWIALRADMDALPMDELNDVPYKSQVKLRAHMCGHDAHTAMLIGAANILSNIRNELKVNVRFIFQPNEEQLPGGAPAMIQDGVLENIDEIYALHVWPTLPVGQYGICVGPAMAIPDTFEITITGRGGHAATPHLAIDPIVIAAEIIQSFQNIISRQIDPLQSAVLTITQIHAGTAYNVIPDTCILRGTVRTFDKKVEQQIKQKMEQILNHITAMHQAKADMNYIHGYPVTYNDHALAHKAKDIAATLVGENNIDFPAQKMMGGEDFAYYAEKIKGCYIHLGCRNEAKGFTRMVHDPRFDLDEECLIYGAALHAELILKNS